MRIPALIVVTLAAVLTAAPAQAQMYDFAYPVCIQTYGIGGGGGVSCRYSSLEQCSASASGRAAQCFANPYFKGAQAPSSRRQRGAY